MSVESMNVANASAGVQPAASKSVQQPVQQADLSDVQTAQPASETAADLQKMTAEEMQGVVDKLNEFMQSGQRNLNFSVDTDTDETVIKVMDTQTQEVVRQFPSEEALKLTKHIEGMMGLIFNDHA